MDFWQIIMTPFSWLLKVFCQWFNSYGVALILFTLVIKIILFPLSLKGKKSMIKMNMISGQMKEIQKRCGNDRERYNQEIQKLYTDNGVSPTGGCGWSMIPLFILMPLYAIIRRPLKYMMRLGDGASSAVATALGLADFKAGAGYSELTLAGMMNAGNLETAKAAATAAGAAAGGMFLINFNFLGVNLAQIPSWKFWVGGLSWNSIGLFLLPIISAVLSFVSMIVSQKTNRMSASDPSSNASSKSMMLISPLISLWIGFSMPAGLCIYWIANSALMMLQEVLCGRILKKDYEKARVEMELQAQKAKEEEKERRRQAAERKAAAIAAGKKKSQPQAKAKNVDPAASREGLRAYARGHAYDPNRYPTTAYVDPDEKYKKPNPEEGPLTEEEKEILAEAGVAIPEEVVEEVSAAVEETVEVSETAAEAGEYEEAYASESEDEEEKSDR